MHDSNLSCYLFKKFTLKLRAKFGTGRRLAIKLSSKFDSGNHCSKLFVAWELSLVLQLLLNLPSSF